MAKFFNKEYKHAYRRGDMVWVQGQIIGQKYHRLSTGKKFSKANMNYAEKHWDEILFEFFSSREEKLSRDNMPTLDTYAKKSFEMNKASRKFYTTDKYEYLYERFISPKLGSKKIDKINASDIKLWYGYLVETINAHEYASKVKAVLSTILSDAMEDELLDKNIVKNIRFPKKSYFKNDGKEEINPFTLEEVQTIIANAPEPFNNIFTFQFFTGARPGEMIALRWEDVNFLSKKIHIRHNRQRDKNPDTGQQELGTTKTGAARTIDMLPIVEAALKRQYKLTGLKSDFVFPALDGQPYMRHDGIAKRQWKATLKRSLLDFRNFYQTRHTFASMFLSKGEDLAWVSKVMLGHANIQTTLKYYARFIKEKDVIRGAFLLDERTMNVQSENLELKSS